MNPEQRKEWEQTRDSGDVDRWLNIVTDASDATILKAQPRVWFDALCRLSGGFILLGDDLSPKGRRLMAAIKERLLPAIAMFEHPLVCIQGHKSVGLALLQVLGLLADMALADRMVLSSLKRYSASGIAFATWLATADYTFYPDGLAIATQECLKILKLEADHGRAAMTPVVKKIGPRAAAKQLNIYYKIAGETSWLMRVTLVAMLMVQTDVEVTYQLFEEKTLSTILQGMWKELAATSTETENGTKVFLTNVMFITQTLWMPGGLQDARSISATTDMIRTCELFSICAIGLYKQLKNRAHLGTYASPELGEVHRFLPSIIRACHQVQPDLIASHIRPYILPFLDAMNDLRGRSPSNHEKDASGWSEAIQLAFGMSETALRRHIRQGEIDRRKANTGGLVGCNWYQCIFHVGEAEGAGTVAMLLDDHCMSAQYCSRYCQKRDWHDGGHKVICRTVS